MPYSVKNGLRIYYETYGEGPPLVMVHANPFDHRLWMHQIAHYSAFHKVIAIDLRGYGRSDKPDAPFELADMARDVIGVCNDECVTHAPFFGVSVGSGISMLIALEKPEMVEALVLVGGSSGGSANMTRRIEGFLSDDLPNYQLHHLRDCVAPAFADSPRGQWLLSLFNERADELSGACIANIFRARLGCDMRERLPNIKAPTLVINGEHDNSMAAGRLTASLIPDARHVTIIGGGHACNIENPEGFDAAVAAFFRDRGLKLCAA
jgi:3-oxoadipate enol-lactonase